MKIFIVFLITVFSVNAGDIDIEPSVVGGTDTQWGQFPASVIVQNSIDICGGTIIDESHILTAASCVLNSRREIISPSWFNIIAGDIFWSPPSARRVNRNVTRVFVHPEYNVYNGDADLAILRLGRPFDLPHNTINRAFLQTRIVRNTLPCVLVAFGRSGNLTSIAVRPRQVQLPQPILDRDTCANVIVFHNRLPERMLCTQTQANAAPCSGSLGSGLYCNGLLTAVLSGGNSCNASPAVYQQVRAFRQWIDTTRAAPLDVVQEVSPFNLRGLPIPLPGV